MARKKDPPKPLLASKFDFVTSRDNVIQESIMFLQAGEMVTDRGMVEGPVADVLKERSAAFRAAIFTDT